MDITTIRSRINTIVRQMKLQKVDCLIFTTAENVSYLTGFMGADSWAVVIGRTAYLITDSRYTEQAQKECIGCRIIERQVEMAKAVAKLLAQHKSVSTAGIEDNCSVATFGSLKKLVKAKLKPVAKTAETARLIKDKDEVESIKEAARIGWEALDYTVKNLRVGMKEYEAAGMLDYQMLKRGSKPSFETILAFGPNGSRNHHQPGDRKLRKNDAILIDFGARCRGYCSDTTRSFAFGRADRFYEKVYYAVADAQRAAISKIKAGVSCVDVDAAARQVIEGLGLPVYGHGTGHGMGLLIHEDPYLNRTAKGVLQAGQVITIEPGIYLPGRFGIRLEDDVLVTENGCEVISRDKRFGYSEYILTPVENSHSVAAM